MKHLITEEGLERLNNRLQEKLALLKKIREEKAHAYHASGDGWHDNPGWIQIGQHEDQVVSEISEIQKSISRAIIIKKPNPGEVSVVRIGMKVAFELKNLKTGAVREQTITIGGTGESDIRNNIVSYDSPVGSGLIGMEIAEEKEINHPAGTIKIRIINICHA